MKIVRTDNFARETESEYFVAENITNQTLGRKMVNGLNKDCHDNDPNWYALVQDDYKLYKFQI
jgi:hypothetical protein